MRRQHKRVSNGLLVGTRKSIFNTLGSVHGLFQKLNLDLTKHEFMTVNVNKVYSRRHIVKGKRPIQTRICKLLSSIQCNTGTVYGRIIGKKQSSFDRCCRGRRRSAVWSVKGGRVSDDDLQTQISESQHWSVKKSMSFRDSEKFLRSCSLPRHQQCQ